ncbi:MAG: fibronectin type III domain-containing protein [Bacteroidales bacterium]|nr:fibronectin type III domain-containing protein [Bacteroidales bacterium]
MKKVITLLLLLMSGGLGLWAQNIGDSAHARTAGVSGSRYCAPVTNLKLVSLGTDHASIMWSCAENMSSWEIVLATTSTAPNLNTTPDFITTDTFYTFQGLTPNTQYYVWVRTNCGVEVSNWTNALSFRTQCLPTSNIPYTENFDNAGGGIGTSVIPECWSRGLCGTYSYFPSVNTQYHHSGSASLRFISSTTNTTLATSQPLDLTSNSESLQLRFFLLSTSSYDGRMDVGYMTDPADFNTFVVIKHLYPSDFPGNSQWYEISAMLPESANGQIVYLAFYCPKTIGGTSNDLYIDDVTVDYHQFCHEMANLQVSDIQSSSAMLTWSGDPNEQVDYVLEYGMAGGQMTSLSVTGTSFMLSGLAEATTYDVMLYANCQTFYSDTLSLTFSTPCAAGGYYYVGNGSSLSSVIPVNTNYSHSYVQELFLANEINNSGTIRSIGFQYVNSTPYDCEMTIFLGETSGSTLTEYLPVANMQQVFSGPITFTDAGTDNWVEIYLDTNYFYGGVHNLVVGIVSSASSSLMGLSNTFQVHAASGKTIHYYASGNIPISPSDYLVGMVENNRNNVMFGMDCDQSVVCIPPNMYVESFGMDTMWLAWAPGGSETLWELEYRESGDTAWSSLGTVSSNPYPVANLTHGAMYEFRLRSICGGDFSDWDVLSVTVPCYITTLPYVDGFENVIGTGTDAFITCWTRGSNNYSGPIYPYASNAYYHTGNYSLYYTGSTSVYSYAAISRLADDIDMTNLSVQFSMYGTSANDGIEVGVMTNPYDIYTFEPLATVFQGVANQWVEKEVFTNSYVGNGRYLAFRIPQGSYSQVYVDDLRVDDASACHVVGDLITLDVTTTTATISWTPNGNEESWEYVYGLSGTVDPNNATPGQTLAIPLTLTGLDPETEYEIYVRSICPEGFSSNWVSLSFMTACLPISTIPVTWDFEEYTTGNIINGANNVPLCWDVYNPGTIYTAYPYVYSNGSAQSNIHAGSHSLGFYIGPSSSFGEQVAFLPEIDTSILNINNLALEFWYRAYSTNTSFMFMVGVTEGTDLSTFVPIDTITATSTTYNLFVVSLNGYQGVGNRIVIRCPKKSSGYNYGYLDEISIVSGTCLRPNNFQMVDSDTSSVTLEWTEYGNAVNWIIEYGPMGFEHGQGTVVNAATVPFTVTGLAPGTVYEFYVCSDCGSGNVSNWCPNSVITYTDALPVSLPYQTDFESGSDVAWMLVDNGALNKWHIGPVTGAGNQLFLSQNAETVSYSNNQNATSYAYKLFDLGIEDSVCISFDVTSGGHPEMDYLKVMLVPENVMLSAGSFNDYANSSSLGSRQSSQYALNFAPYASQSTGNIQQYPYIYNLTNGSVHVTGKLPNPSPYHHGRLVFYWTNSFFGNGVGATIDNVSLWVDSADVHACSRPNMLSGTAVSSTSVTLSWVSTGDYFNVYYRPEGDSIYASLTHVNLLADGTFPLSGLIPGTQYEWYVVGYCEDGDSLVSDPSFFVTDCGNLQLPYHANFDNMGANQSVFPLCWMRPNPYAYSQPSPYVTSQFHHSGNASLYFYTHPSQMPSCIAVLPPVDGQVNPVNTLMLSFYMLTNNNLNTVLEVGVMSDPNDTSTFVMVDTVRNTAMSTYEPREVYLNNYQGNGTYVAMRFAPMGNPMSFVYVDDLTLSVIPSCTRPHNVNITTIAEDSMVVDWTDMTVPVGWVLEYGPSGFAHGTGNTMAVQSHPVVITGLSPGNDYDVYVKTNCGSESSEWSLLTVASTPCNAPTALMASNVTTSSATISWTAGGVETLWEFQYWSVYTGTWQSTILDTTSYAMTGLYSNMSYLIRVRSICNATVNSEWMEGQFFTLEDIVAECPAPTNLTASVNYTSVTLTWEQAPNTADEWHVNYRQSPDGAWSMAVTDHIPYILHDLLPDIWYEINVVAHCDDDIQSFESNTVTIQTHGTGVWNYLDQSVQLYPNPATEHVDVVANDAGIRITGVEVYNVYGQVVETFHGTSLQDRITINVNGLSGGMYYVRVTTEDGVVTKNFVKK